jgi:hypothetical protein
MEHQDRHNQSRRGWRPEQMQSMGSEMWTEQTQANEIDRKTETDDGQGGEDPDEYGEDQEEALFAEGEVDRPLNQSPRARPPSRFRRRG